MCDSLHEEHKKIPEKGFGYKLFTQYSNKVLGPLCKDNVYLTTNGRVVWNENPKNGFCFFITLKEAKRSLKYWPGHYSDVVLCRIKYAKGLGKCQHHLFTIALCQEFEILEKVKVERRSPR